FQALTSPPTTSVQVQGDHSSLLRKTFLFKMSQDKLKLPFEEIKDATNNFENCIGHGGYGRVYKGELTIHGKLTTVAVKRLNEHLGQGLKEFLTEIDLLSGQHHPNLISLVGYCDEGKEKIIVYEYAERGSFDKYIKRTNNGTTTPTPTLTWVERLKICAGAARGLDHLHNHVGVHQSVIHRDIKSGNILISKKWVAKISDLGLSKLSLAGLDRSAVISHACGTPGYCEPEYKTSGVVTKKSDVYSFGMVLFEALCGRLCNVQEDDGFVLSDKLAKDYYKLNKLDDIVDPGLREQMSEHSMTKFSAIAYRCLHDDREQRPSMDVVKKELEETLKNQTEARVRSSLLAKMAGGLWKQPLYLRVGVEYEIEKKKKLKSHVVPEKPESYWESKLPRDWNSIMMMLEFSFASKTTKKKLYFLLQNGILFDGGNKTSVLFDCIQVGLGLILEYDGSLVRK
ncbi:serine-threonine/tyrosine-protein kinase catalytic domain-containing protein, partial [Tanacetum coccineum]